MAKVSSRSYDLKGDILKSCVAAADKERPTEFAAKVGTGQTLRLFKRVRVTNVKHQGSHHR